MRWCREVAQTARTTVIPGKGIEISAQTQSSSPYQQEYRTQALQTPHLKAECATTWGAADQLWKELDHVGRQQWILPGEILLSHRAEEGMGVFVAVSIRKRGSEISVGIR